MSTETNEGEATVDQLKAMRDRINEKIGPEETVADQGEFENRLKAAGNTDFVQMVREKYGFVPRVW